jgi:hypothetical protein
MGNPGMDEFNMQTDDVLSSQRQKEIEELTKKLTKFKPTHVVLEIRSKQDSITNMQYQQYLKGKFKLPANESYQLGFRLAKMNNNTKVYCVDEAGPFDFGKVMQFAMQNGFGNMVQEMTTTIQNFIKEEENILKKTTLPDYYKRINHPDQHSMSHDWHLNLLHIANKNEFPGAELVRDLYDRNLKIMANILKIGKQEPEARILVIYGSSHSAFFKSIINLSNEIEIIESYDYLK